MIARRAVRLAILRDFQCLRGWGLNCPGGPVDYILQAYYKRGPAGLGALASVWLAAGMRFLARCSRRAVRASSNTMLAAIDNVSCCFGGAMAWPWLASGRVRGCGGRSRGSGQGTAGVEPEQVLGYPVDGQAVPGFGGRGAFGLRAGRDSRVRACPTGARPGDVDQ